MKGSNMQGMEDVRICLFLMLFLRKERKKETLSKC
jgi:hypothetical protein